jgi:hypothetical protein
MWLGYDEKVRLANECSYSGSDGELVGAQRGSKNALMSDVQPPSIKLQI